MRVEGVPGLSRVLGGWVSWLLVLDCGVLSGSCGVSGVRPAGSPSNSVTKKKKKNNQATPATSLPQRSHLVEDLAFGRKASLAFLEKRPLSVDGLTTKIPPLPRTI